MTRRWKLVARLLYIFSHGHSLSGMCACDVMLMQSFIHVNASGQITVHSSALLGNSKSEKCRENSSQATLAPFLISARFLSIRPLRLAPSTRVYTIVIPSSASTFRNSALMNSCPLSKRAMSQHPQVAAPSLTALCQTRKAWHKVGPLLSHRNSGHSTLVFVRVQF